MKSLLLNCRQLAFWLLWGVLTVNTLGLGVAEGQCVKWIQNPFTRKLDCANDGSGGTAGVTSWNGQTGVVTATLPQNTGATAGQFFSAYNATTGAFTKAQVGFGDLQGVSSANPVFNTVVAQPATDVDNFIARVTAGETAYAFAARDAGTAALIWGITKEGALAGDILDLSLNSLTVNSQGAGTPVVGRTHASTVAGDPFFGVQNSGSTWLGGFLGDGKYNNPSITSGAAVFDADGTLQKVSGTATDCVLVDGTSGPCGAGGFGETSLAGLVNNQILWDGSQASRTLTAGLSGANDPVFTFSDATVNLSVGTLQVGGVTVVTAAPSATVGQVLRIGAGPTVGFGAVDLADSDAVTGLLPDANIAASIARDSEVTAATTNMVTAAGTLTADAPMIGGGGKAAAVGSRSGNTTEFVTQSGSKTQNAITVYDADGNIVASGCSVASGVLACGDGTDPAFIELKETTAGGGTFAFRIYGASDQSANGCIVVEGSPADDQILKATSSTVSLDGFTCRVMAWEADAGSGSGMSEATHQSGSVLRCASATGTDAYTCTMTPTLTAYTDGMVVEFEATSTAGTGTITVNIDGLGAVPVKLWDGTDPGSGGATYIPVGIQVPLRYDSTANVFYLPYVPDVPYSPTGGISGDTLREAVFELDMEKLALAGGTMTGALTLDNLGIYGVPDATPPTCNAGEYRIYMGSGTTWKKCENGVVTDLDTGSGNSDTNCVFDDTDADNLDSTSCKFTVPNGSTYTVAGANALKTGGAGKVFITAQEDGELHGCTTGTLAVTLSATTGTFTDDGACTTFPPNTLKLYEWEHSGTAWETTPDGDHLTNKYVPQKVSPGTGILISDVGNDKQVAVDTAVVPTKSAANTFTNVQTVAGVEFTESDTNPACAAGNYNIFADLSENKLKKCVNGSASDLDTAGGSPAFSDITSGSNTTATMTVGTGASLAPTGGGTIEANVAPSEAYDATGWNGDTAPPQKDAVRDKIEALAPGGVVADSATAPKYKTWSKHYKLWGTGASFVLQDTDDEQTIFRNEESSRTITKVVCESDTGTPTIMLQKDDGSPADMFAAAMTCNTSPSGTDGTTGILTSFQSGENVLATGVRLDHLTATAGGSAHWVAITISGTID